MKSKITLDGLALVGNLFTPIRKGADADGYAQRFADQGFVAFAFDYAHYGERRETASARGTPG
ncbi:hypothetical protein [Arthrobacter globiformis]|uniref:hypothetical protein n=1 Tax=Arthrobacter globiformis TaxID=1665 RepID=UPI002793EE3A|nr:hypothetical protein [Arthrobacter globiformis]MDQ0618737.1 hypothetical protein [Arthrobacter globiformis]